MINRLTTFSHKNSAEVSTCGYDIPGSVTSNVMDSPTIQCARSLDEIDRPKGPKALKGETTDGKVEASSINS